jgi:hypothetical protein
MARPLEEVFGKVIASDAYPYGYGLSGTSSQSRMGLAQRTG